jgi:hypothetical protein
MELKMTKRITREFPIDDLKELAWEDEPDGYKYIATEDNGLSRWSSHHTTIFEFDGELWASDWSVGRSESQDQCAYEYDDPIAYRVEARTKVVTTTEYVPVTVE